MQYKANGTLERHVSEAVFESTTNLNTPQHSATFAVDKIMTGDDTTACAIVYARASSKSWMCVIDSRVNNSDLDTLASVPERLSNEINAGHLVRGRQVRMKMFIVRMSTIGVLKSPDGPNTLDASHPRQVAAIVARLDLNRDAVEHAVLVTNIERMAGLGITEDTGFCVIEAFLELRYKFNVDERQVIYRSIRILGQRQKRRRVFFNKPR